MRFTRRLLAEVAILAALLVPGVALAHATLVSSDPPAGATVGTGAGTITATFAEVFDPGRSSMLLIAPDGSTVATAKADAPNKTMTLSYPPLAGGTYTVRWTTVTPDDNGVERGTFTITAATGVGGTGSAATGGVAASVEVAPSAGAASPADAPGPAGGGSGGTEAVVLAVVVVLLVAVVAILLMRRRTAG